MFPCAICSQKLRSTYSLASLFLHQTRQCETYHRVSLTFIIWRCETYSTITINLNKISQPTHVDVSSSNMIRVRRKLPVLDQQSSGISKSGSTFSIIIQLIYYFNHNDTNLLFHSPSRLTFYHKLLNHNGTSPKIFCELLCLCN